MRQELWGVLIVVVMSAGVSLQAAVAVVIPEPAGPSLVVRTYTHPDSARDITTARRVASAILERAAIRVEWVECGLPDAASASGEICRRPRKWDELVVRVVPLANTSGSVPGGSLGFAFVDLQAGGGWLATVYPDRVERLAKAAAVDRAELLGRAMAHEIGHLLLGTNDHADAGLMRASWSGADLRRNRAAEWVFHRDEGEAMRRRIATTAVEAGLQVQLRVGTN